MTITEEQKRVLYTYDIRCQPAIADNSNPMWAELGRVMAEDIERRMFIRRHTPVEELIKEGVREAIKDKEQMLEAFRDDLRQMGPDGTKSQDDFAKKLLDGMHPCPPEFLKVLNDNLEELLA